MPEVSPNNRAGCQATHCKAEGVKIKKGEIRQGVLVTIKEHTSMKYRHWYAGLASHKGSLLTFHRGCVTPQVIVSTVDKANPHTQIR